MTSKETNNLLAIFREYDIRGIFEVDLTADTVKKIGYFYAKKTLELLPNASYISVGFDARLHSPIIRDWLVSGINYAGLKVLDMGLVPTPVNYFSNFQDNNISASVMITGSHNPKEYNGFKLTLNKKPFFGEDIKALGTMIANSDIIIPDDLSSNEINTANDYVDFITEHFKHLENLDFHFAFDCGNGAAGPVLRRILDNLNIKYHILYEKPDGNFPNHHPDPSEEENLNDLKNLINFEDFKLGFAYDGDGDRLAVLNQNYNFKGDVLAIFLSSFIENPLVIGEVKCSKNMYDIINERGTCVMYKTGHSNLKTKISELNASMAAEVSGHLFFNDRYFGFDDAIYSTFRVIELVSNGFDFDEEYDKLPETYVTEEINIPVSETYKFKIIEDFKVNLNNIVSLPEIQNVIEIDGLRVEFSDGWGLIRASNTTPMLVTRFESTNKDNRDLYKKLLLESLQDIISKQL